MQLLFKNHQQIGYYEHEHGRIAGPMMSQVNGLGHALIGQRGDGQQQS